MNDKVIHIKGELVSLRRPLVMGILNLTPDSFFAGSRKQTELEIHERIETILEEGGGVIDLGAYSSRPGAGDVPVEEEMRRLAVALAILLRHYPDVVVSVDTFRAEVARRAVEQYGVAMINDISGGEADGEMFATVASLKTPYVLMHLRGMPETMQSFTGYDDLITDIRRYFAEKVYALELLGVNDIIIDPGFGFSKTLDQNYELLRRLSDFSLFGFPLLVGVSRKAMVYRLLDTGPEESLNGTSVLHTLALLKGANILRVHDVRAAVEVVRIVEKYAESDFYLKTESPCGCISE